MAEGYPNQSKVGDYITIVSLVWGGISLGNYVNEGAFYDPRTDTWTAISTTNAPSPRLFFAAGWDSTNLFYRPDVLTNKLCESPMTKAESIQTTSTDRP